VSYMPGAVAARRPLLYAIGVVGRLLVLAAALGARRLSERGRHAGLSLGTDTVGTVPNLSNVDEFVTFCARM